MSRCDPVQNLLRLDLQVLFPGGEGLKPSLPTLRGVEGDFPVLLNPQGVRSLLDHRAVHRLIDRGGPGIEIQRLQQGLLVRRVPVVQGIGPCVDRAEGRLGKQHHIGGQVSANEEFSKANWPPLGTRSSSKAGKTRLASRSWAI